MVKYGFKAWGGFSVVCWMPISRWLVLVAVCVLLHLLMKTYICQARILLEKAHALSEKWGKVPVAIAGDFNSTPGVCEVLMSSIYL